MADKIIVDTNLWISFFIKQNLRAFQERIFQKDVLLIFSEKLIGEIKDVLNRDLFRERLRPDDFNILDQLISGYGTIVPVTTAVEICRDPKDNFLLALAIDSKADFLITGDKDLLVLQKIQETTIITYRDWIEKE